MTSKQRAGRRSLANGLDTVMQIGKGGITEAVIQQAEQAICNKELIKVRVLESALLTTREACETLAQAIGASRCSASAAGSCCSAAMKRTL